MATATEARRPWPPRSAEGIRIMSSPSPAPLPITVPECVGSISGLQRALAARGRSYARRLLLQASSEPCGTQGTRAVAARPARRCAAVRCTADLVAVHRASAFAQLRAEGRVHNYRSSCAGCSLQTASLSINCASFSPMSPGETTEGEGSLGFSKRSPAHPPESLRTRTARSISTRRTRGHTLMANH